MRGTFISKIPRLSSINRSIRPPSHNTYDSSSIADSSVTIFHQQRQRPAVADASGIWRWRWPPSQAGSVRGFSQFATGFTPLQHKPLESIIDMDRAKNRSSDDLIEIWDDYHLGRGHMGTSMKAKLYNLLVQRSISCRHFVLPLWRGSGYTNMFIQVQMPHILFTGLEDYKARGTQASPYFTVTHYTEFEESKDLVLVRGDIVFTSKLSDSEAQWLLQTAQSFYLDDMRYKLVERFNKDTPEFEFKDVLQALELPTL